MILTDGSADEAVTPESVVANANGFQRFIVVDASGIGTTGVDDIAS